MATDGAPLKVIVAGAGVAGLEATLALSELAGQRVQVQLLAPEPEFVYRPLRVREPFDYGAAERYAVADVIDGTGARLLSESFSWVDPAKRLVHTENGLKLPYDALLLALGARARARFTHAYAIDDRHLDDILRGLLQDVEDGYVKRLAFVVPARMGWQLPIYEIALMTARRAGELGMPVQATILTPEPSPLALFGIGASEAVSKLLADAGIEAIVSAYVEVPGWDTVVVNPGDRRLSVDRVVALPELYGPAVRGLPAADHGFIPCDAHSKVRGMEAVYAAGDAVDFAVKHGSVSAQQADAAAEAIAALAGADLKPAPLDLVVYGMLLTGGAPKYLRAHVFGGHGFDSEVSDQPLWGPPRKIVARYLGPRLEQLRSR
ncbi:MAG TPA: FAD-dependent oxidoreductase [Solirubrobacteraceae bacterium]|nr:FAD-dependent oxidoreductase [Solirubrobacteraceae bacterium]